MLYFLCCMDFVFYVCCINMMYACCIFRIVFHFIFLTFYFPLFWNWNQNWSRLMRASSWFGLILHSIQKNVIPSCISCRLSADIFTTNVLYLIFSLPIFCNWNLLRKLRDKLKSKRVSLDTSIFFWVGSILQSNVLQDFQRYFYHKFSFFNFFLAFLKLLNFSICVLYQRVV